MRLWRFKITTCLRCSFFAMVCLLLYFLHTQISRASIYGIFNIVTVDIPDTIDDLRPKDYQPLEKFSAREAEFHQEKLKIFFVQTSRNPYLLSRHACSIEAAARLHRKGSIYVLLHSQVIDTNHPSYLHLQSYPNIHFLHFTEDEIYAQTLLMKSKQIHRRQLIEYFSISHTSDLIRTALLYKYGGIYFDLDVIALKPFDSFVNTVAIESSSGVNVAALAFEKGHLALELQMQIQLDSMDKQFQAFCWNCLGPAALTEALKTVCDQHQLHLRAKDKCHQVDILPSFVFYPIDYQEIPQFFRGTSPSDSVSMLNLMKNASVYSIHYFHHMTMNLPIERMSPFAQLAQYSCPNISPQLVN